MILILLGLLFTFNFAYGESGNSAYVCMPTKAAKVASKPIMQGITYTDNDATKNSGDFDSSYMRKVVLRGLIKDRNCVPVPNATIEIWQVDEYGKNRYNTFSYSFLDKYALNYEEYSRFLGIAVTTSDSNGYFTFLTVLPNGQINSKSKPITSYINLSVWHRDLPSLETKLTLDDGFRLRMPIDTELIGYKNSEAENLFVLPTYDFEVVLDGVSKYKSY